MSDAWTEYRTKALSELLEQGLSYSQAAALIGVSRSAALGKARRLGIAMVPKARPSAAPDAPAPRRVRFNGLNIEAVSRTVRNSNPHGGDPNPYTPVSLPRVKFLEGA